MSVAVMSEVWANPPVGGSALLVLLALADNADEERRMAWPSIPTLARKTRTSESTVHRAIKELESLNIIRRQERSGTSSLYWIAPPSKWNPCQSDTPVTGDTPTPVTGDTPPLSPVTPEPSGNHHGEPSPSCAVSDDARSDAQAALVPLPQPSISAQRRNRQDVVWDALMAVCGIDSGAAIPRSARGAYNRAVADLKAVGADPSEIARRAAVFRARWPEVSLTPTALARRWPECAQYVATAPAQALRRQAEQESLMARVRAMDAAAAAQEVRYR